jgi:hypothetical protein
MANYWTSSASPPPWTATSKLHQWAGRWPQRCWAVEGAIGRALAQWLSRAGDRKLDHALYMMAMVQVRRIPTAASRPWWSGS